MILLRVKQFKDQGDDLYEELIRAQRKLGLGDRFAVLCQKMGTAAENNGLRAALEKDYGPLLRRLENAGHISRDMAFEQIEDLNAVPCIYIVCDTGRMGEYTRPLLTTSFRYSAGLLGSQRCRAAFR